MADMASGGGDDSRGGIAFQPTEERTVDTIDKAAAIAVPSANLSHWRNVTADDALRAIQGTAIEPIVAALASPTTPPLPPQVTIPRALALAGSIMSKPVPGWKDMDKGTAGPELARFRINTGGTGQIPVIWALLAGPTASGKDIGDLMPTLSRRFGIAIGTLASGAGLYECLAEMGAGLLTVSEFEAYLDKTSSRATARTMLTTAFNAYSFDIRLSGKSRKSSRYAALSIAANIQPNVLQYHARRIHVDSGFLPRFLISMLPGATWRPSSGKMDLSAAVDALTAYDTLCGDVTPPDNYLGGLRSMFTANGADRRLFGRYVDEYGPRFACILQADGQEIRAESWDRASVLVRWFYSMAEAALGDTLAGRESTRFERDMISLSGYIQRVTRETGGVLKARISRNWGLGTATYRNKLLAELVERGVVRALTDGRYVYADGGSPA